MKKLMAVLCAAGMILALSGCSKKAEKGEFTVEKGKLMIAMEVGYPPFEYYADDGKTPMGFDVELGKEVAKRLGLEPVFIDTAWDGIFAGLDTDRYDTVMSAATITPERVQNYTFSQPYIGNGQAIILQKDSTLSIKEFSDLAGLKVGYQAETTSDFYTKKHSEGWTYVENAYDKVMNAYDDLKLKRIDAVVSDSLVAVDYLAKPNSEFKQVWAAEPDEYFGVCMKKGNTALQAKIDQAINEMKADGTLKNIYIKIFGMDLSDSIK
ncbi:ABC transporter substrate-binding protein [Treponema sp.]|uniref:ABC transporter substrate-binding protein n=1 Tax=Treponema sp. TaxID=166 RepID=UPI00298EA078|nr:ABC transporter substrate-binding protein [Treponema sp.]MCQ2242323.1 ABC transporter substrate-binding protein [Treponema sp.]